MKMMTEHTNCNSNNRNDDNEWWMMKYHTIEDCLRGSIDEEEDDDTNDTNNSSKIDLWQLRELSLSYGGLLDPKLRKRAWPILTQAMMITNNNMNHHNNDTSSSQQQQYSSINIGSKDIVRIQRDVKRTVWNIKGHFHKSQQQSQLIKPPTISSSSTTTTSNRRVQFDTDMNNQNEFYDYENESQTTMSSFQNNTTTQNGGSSTTNSHYSSKYRRSSSSSNGIINKSNMISKQEQRTIFNVLSSCLSKAIVNTNNHNTYDEYDNDDDGCLHYYTGLQNLTAVIMINVESLSISSLVLSKLAMYQLRDALRNNNHKFLDTAVTMISLPLLYNIDIDLFNHIIIEGFDSNDIGNNKNTHVFTSCIVSWIANWFATDITDIMTISRLLDVFIVSHPTTPIYCAIAILVYYRDSIIMLSNFQDVAQCISLFQLENSDDDDNNSSNKSLEIVEKIISMTLCYMEQYPPSKLIKMNETSQLWSNETTMKQLMEQIPTIVMFTSTPPIWHNADTSPNEWTIIQNTIHPNKVLNGNNKSLSPIKVTRKKYPLATVALGHVVIPSSYEDVMHSSNAVAKLSVCFVIIVFVTMCMIPNSRPGVPNSTITPKIKVDEELLLQSVMPSINVEKECFECISHKGNESSIGIIQTYFNDTLSSYESHIENEIQEEESILEENNMIMPSTLSPVNDDMLNIEPSFVFLENDTTDTNSTSDEDSILPESLFYEDTEIQVAYNNQTIPLSIIESKFDQIVLQLIHYRTEKMEHRVQQILHPISNIVQHRLLNIYNELQQTAALEFINHWVQIIRNHQALLVQTIVAMVMILHENLKTRVIEMKQLRNKLKENDIIQTWKTTMISIVTSNGTILNSYVQILLTELKTLHDRFQQSIANHVKESLLTMKSHVVFTIKKTQHSMDRITNRLVENMNQCMINCESRSI